MKDTQVEPREVEALVLVWQKPRSVGNRNSPEWVNVVDRIMAPHDVDILIPRGCESVT